MPHARTHLGAAAAALAVGFSSMAGPLTPPAGPPMSTGKTLTQVEPRVDVATLPGSSEAVHVIDRPGSYYLTGDVVVPMNRVGVSVEACGVTLDLGGFSIASLESGSVGVTIAPGAERATIYRGRIAVNAVPISAIDETASGALFENLVLNATGEGPSTRVPPGSIVRHVESRGGGFRLLGGNIVFDRCVVLNAPVGITRQGGQVVTGVLVSGVLIDGIEAVPGHGTPPVGIDLNADAFIIDSVVTGVQGDGIRVGEGSSIRGTTVADVQARGVVCDGGSLVVHTLVRDTGGDGIVAIRSAILSSMVESAGGTGIVLGAGSTLENSRVLGAMGPGVTATNDTRIVGNAITNGQAAGVVLTFRHSVVDSNLISSHANGAAIEATGRHFVTRNFLINNTVDIGGDDPTGVGIAPVEGAIRTASNLNPFANLGL